MFWAQRDNEASAALVSHTLAVEVRLGGFASSNERLETARRGLLLTGNPAFATIMGEAKVGARKNLAALMDLTRDNPRQQQRTARLRALLDAYGIYHRRSVQLTGAARQEMIANFMSDTGVGYVREARRVVDTMLDEERRLLRSREARQQQTQFLFTATLAGTGLLILIVAAATLFLVRRNLADLRDSREELNNLNAGLEQLVDARTAELQRANSEIQRFAYIVSHDLRSPSSMSWDSRPSLKRRAKRLRVISSGATPRAGPRPTAAPASRSMRICPRRSVSSAARRRKWIG